MILTEENNNEREKKWINKKKQPKGLDLHWVTRKSVICMKVSVFVCAKKDVPEWSST